MVGAIVTQVGGFRNRPTTEGVIGPSPEDQPEDKKVCERLFLLWPPWERGEQRCNVSRDGVYIISQWKQIGVEAEHKLEESATWSKTRVSRDFELLLDPYGGVGGDPDEMLVRFTTGASGNHGRFSDPMVDTLFKQQAREMDEQKRIQLVKKIDKRILEKVWRIQGLWTKRMEVRIARIHNYEPHPSHWANRRFEDVWIAQK